MAELTGCTNSGDDAGLTFPPSVTQNEIQVDETCYDRDVLLEYGAYLNLSLPANPTTGYDWDLRTYDPEVLQYVGATYTASVASATGSAGRKVYRFRGRTEGKSVLMLLYRRSWEPVESAISSFTTRVLVKDTAY